MHSVKPHWESITCQHLWYQMMYHLYPAEAWQLRQLEMETACLILLLYSFVAMSCWQNVYVCSQRANYMKMPMSIHLLNQKWKSCFQGLLRTIPFIFIFCYQMMHLISMRNKKNLVDAIQCEAVNTCTNYTWCGLLQICALAEILKDYCTIISVYPSVTYNLRSILNGPIFCNDPPAKPPSRCLHLLWTRCGQLNTTPGRMFQPNHFVPILNGREGTKRKDVDESEIGWTKVSPKKRRKQTTLNSFFVPKNKRKPSSEENEQSNKSQPSQSQRHKATTASPGTNDTREQRSETKSTSAEKKEYTKQTYKATSAPPQTDDSIKENKGTPVSSGKNGPCKSKKTSTSKSSTATCPSFVPNPVNINAGQFASKSESNTSSKKDQVSHKDGGLNSLQSASLSKNDRLVFSATNHQKWTTPPIGYSLSQPMR